MFNFLCEIEEREILSLKDLDLFLFFYVNRNFSNIDKILICLQRRKMIQDKVFLVSRVID